CPVGYHRPPRLLTHRLAPLFVPRWALMRRLRLGLRLSLHLDFAPPRIAPLQLRLFSGSLGRRRNDNRVRPASTIGVRLRLHLRAGGFVAAPRPLAGIDHLAPAAGARWSRRAARSHREP